MSLRKFGLAITITALSMLSVAAMEESASAGRRSGHHHHEHHGQYGHYGLKKHCFVHHGQRYCRYVKF